MPLMRPAETSCTGSSLFCTRQVGGVLIPPRQKNAAGVFLDGISRVSAGDTAEGYRSVN